MENLKTNLFGGILWGFSGVCGQYLFAQKGISFDWLVFLVGAVLVIYFDNVLRIFTSQKGE